MPQSENLKSRITEMNDFIPRQINNNNEHKFLKVTPNLFTPERLHLFDSTDLYTSLINCTKYIEQGERLNNLSWRILNKALLKDHNINKSKKRDGVKNIYYVLNPVSKQQQQQQQRPKSSQQGPQPSQKGSTNNNNNKS